MALTMKEIVKWCEQEKREFWEYMLEEDKRERMISTDLSMSAMEKTFTVMCETIDTYRSERMSASGLVGDEGGKLEKYRTQSVDKVEENGKQSPLCGNFMGEAMVIALKMAESNACMRRIVAAQRLVPVECYQWCNSILSHENGRKRGNCKSVV